MMVLAALVLRIGIIGTDTSHVPAFTKVINEGSAARVVAAYKGGSPDLESSRSRVDNYAKEIADKYGVELVDSIEALLGKVDAVLLESVDGRVHLRQARAVIAARKPLFIDKPLASTLADAREIARLAREGNVPWFSSSSLRFAPFIAALKSRASPIAGAIAWSPGPYEPHHALDLSWYGIHGVETLYTLMGPGCQTVVRTSTPDSDEVTCTWKDQRIGTVRLLRPKAPYGATAFYKDGSSATSPPDAKVDYQPLVEQVLEFFRTGKPPVPPEETIEIMEFLDAAQRSKAADGKPVLLHYERPHPR